MRRIILRSYTLLLFFLVFLFFVLIFFLLVLLLYFYSWAVFRGSGILGPGDARDHPFIIQLPFDQVGGNDLYRYFITHPELAAAATAHQAVIALHVLEVIIFK